MCEDKYSDTVRMLLSSLTGENQNFGGKPSDCSAIPVRSGPNSVHSLPLRIRFKLCNIGINIHATM